MPAAKHLLHRMPTIFPSWCTSCRSCWVRASLKLNTPPSSFPNFTTIAEYLGVGDAVCTSSTSVCSGWTGITSVHPRFALHIRLMHEQTQRRQITAITFMGGLRSSFLAYDEKQVYCKAHGRGRVQMRANFHSEPNVVFSLSKLR